MSELPDAGGLGDLFDDDDDEQRTVVDSSFWNSPDIPDYPPLAHFGRFEILGRIARGGMAEVYLAREWDDSGKARYLVVKRVLPEMEDNGELLAMFLDEGSIARRLYHPNVCHVYECGEIDGHTFMALEWVWGPSLSEIIEAATARGGCIPWPVAVEIVAQVATALHYVHHAKGTGGKALNIVHRDVSPHNVNVSWAGAVKLLDFGIAKTSHEHTGSGGLVGKYGYMSPEQAQSQRVDARSDIFALGIVLYETLTSQGLYDRPTLLDTLSAIVREPVPSLRAARPELPESLEAIVNRALAKDPAHRFQSAGEFKAALSQVLRTNGQTVTETRIRLVLDGLFDAKAKLPLRDEGRRLTGSFAGLTAEGAEALLASQSVSTYATFEHEPPAPKSAAPKSSLAQKIALGAALVVLAILMVSVGAGLAILLFR